MTSKVIAVREEPRNVLVRAGLRGRKGPTIVSAEVNAEGRLVIVLEDGTQIVTNPIDRPWGTIAGDITQQADLMAQLAARVLGTDPRLSDARVPTGGAGGVLSGSYPNPGFAVDMATQAELDTAVALRVPLTQKGAPSGVATLDAGGHVPMTQVSVDVMRVSAVVDNLTSTATDRPLSANQGRALKQLLDQIQAILDSDDIDLDEIQEIVDYIKQNREDLQNLSVENIAGLVDALAGKADTSGDYANLRARATTAADVGLGAVDNTADNAKPVSTAQATAIASAQAHAVQRSNHTGEQPISSVTGLQTALADIDTMTIYGAYRA